MVSKSAKKKLREKFPEIVVVSVFFVLFFAFLMGKYNPRVDSIESILLLIVEVSGAYILVTDN